MKVLAVVRNREVIAGAGIVLSGLVAAVIAFRLFDDYTKAQARKELRREAAGITKFYEENAGPIASAPIFPPASTAATARR